MATHKQIKTMVYINDEGNFNSWQLKAFKDCQVENKDISREEIDD